MGTSARPAILTFSLFARKARWAAGLTEFSAHTRRLTGNRIQVLDYELADLRRRYTTDDDAACALFWRSVAEDALTLAGSDFREIVEGGHHATR